MTWARIDDKLWLNPKQLAMSDAAYRVWSLSISRCSDCAEPNGFLATVQALAFVRMLGKSPKVIEELVKLNAWEKVEGGYQLHDFGKYLSPTSTARVQALREKIKANAEALLVTQRNVTETLQKRASRATGKPEPVPVPEPVPSTSSNGDSVEQAALELGEVALVVNDLLAAWLETMPPGTQRDLSGKTASGRNRRALVSKAVKEHGQPDVYSALRGHRWDDWEGRAGHCDVVDCLRPANFERFRDWENGINRPARGLNPRSRQALAYDAELAQMEEQFREDERLERQQREWA